MATKTAHQVDYEKLGREAAAFAKMVADFPKYGSGEFLKLYPDYDYNGTDYICHRAEKLADALDEYINAHLSPMGREARKANAAEQVSA